MMGERSSTRTRLLMLLVLAGLPACAQTARLSPTPTATATAPVVRGGPDATFAPLPEGACGWAWANQDLPQVTAAFQEALAAASLPFEPEATYAYAFGENCLRSDGTADHFATLETDFVVTTNPPDPTDRSVMGDFAGTVLGIILNDFRPGVVPGPQRGNVRFVIMAGGETTQYQVLISDAETALGQHLSGEELYEALFH